MEMRVRDEAGVTVPAVGSVYGRAFGLACVRAALGVRLFITLWAVNGEQVTIATVWSGVAAMSTTVMCR
ncbi:hypothetical protein ETD83_16040 [Actinomadura soli]|uniref:Uncharacterized protein n=1 Tax=Actinomadura soli TaxID=2508997 RepID=A0A5C4JE54_9ACTN|nr:hypothetical protein [Actinomadura soli]TMR00765.1 hypothetical protein ETD83_16040 [Actinomadura soli]